jgi:anti-anti-sigma factor
LIRFKGNTDVITRNSTSNTLLVKISGNLDALKVEHYRHEIRALFGQGFHSIIFDMEKAPYVNSSGLGLLVECFNSVKKLNGTFTLINLGEQILSLFRQTQLDTILLSDAAGDVPDQGNGHIEVQDRVTHEGMDEKRVLPEKLAFDLLHEVMSREILLLSNFNEILTRTLQMEDTVEIGCSILEGILDATGAGRGIIFYLNESFNRLEPVHALDRKGAKPAASPVDYYQLKRNCKVSRIMKGEKVSVLKRGELESKGDILFTRLDYDKMLVSSIPGKHRHYGLIVIDVGESPDSIVDLAMPAFQALTRLCGLALEKAALMQKVTMQNQKLVEALSGLSQAHQSLINAGRLAALGTVIYGLGHQLNNKMVPMLGYLQILTKNQQLPEDVVDKLSTMNEAGQEIQAVIEKLVRVSRVREPRNQMMDINERLQVALDLLRCQFQQTHIDLRLQLADSLPSLTGDPELFLQAVIAILHCSCMSFHDDQTSRHVGLSTSVHHDHIRIEVEDNGCDPGEFDNEDWLDPLVPLEAIKDGSIFNYNIPRSVIRRHKGSMNVESLDQGGKRITIDLPLSPEISYQAAG